MFNLFKKEKALDLRKISCSLRERNWNVVKSDSSSIVINVDYFNTYKMLRNGKRQKYSVLTLKSNKKGIDIIDESGYIITTVSENEIFSEIMDICNIVSNRNFAVAINNRMSVIA